VAWERISTADSLLLIAPLAGAPELGELRNDYAQFLQQLESYKFGKSNRTTATSANVGAVQQQIGQLERSIALEQTNQRRVATQLQSSREMLERQQKLLDEGLIARLDFERERARFLDVERTYDAHTDAVLRKRSEISNLQRSIGIVRFDEKLDVNSTEGRLRASLSNLRTSLDRWKQAYLLTAPIKGVVSLNKFYAAQQYVKQGEQVLTIAPFTNTRIVGRSLLPIAGSGKVQPHQRVIIKLDNFPYYEFGTLRGVVLNKSAVPKDNAYPITIGLDSTSGTTTDFNHTIVFQQQLQGDAEIVTADKRFLQRIVDQLFASAR
jgi:HlyD family secretion protein